MNVPLTIQEGRCVPIEQLLGSDPTSEAIERLRRRVAALGRQLRKDLGLREDALTIKDVEDGIVLETRGIAGTLRIGSFEVDIPPKHVVDETVDWRGSLVTMLHRVVSRRATYSGSNRLQLRHRTFLDQFAYGFAAELEAALRNAPIQSYRSETQELTRVRGRLLIAEQFRVGLLKPHRLICEVNEMNSENDANRLLHWAGARLAALTRDASVRRFLERQLAKLPPVQGPITRPPHLRIVVPRQFSYFESPVQLAMAFARGRATFPGASGVNGAGFVIGTERLFESFIERSLKVALDKVAEESWTVRSQVTEPFAFPIRKGGNRYFSRPDNIVDLDAASVLIIDAKYKKLGDSTTPGPGKRPTNADIYQMSAAIQAHGVRRALLVYPALTGDSEVSGVWQINWWSLGKSKSDPLVGAVKIDLSTLNDPRNLSTFDDQLATLVRNAAQTHTKPIEQESAATTN